MNPQDVHNLNADRDSGPRFPGVEVALSDGDGNAFYVIGRICRALRRAGVSPEEVAEFRAEATSGDYDNVLQTAMRWVEVS